MPHHHLLTLGAPLFLSEAGEQIRFRTRKHLALLVRLAVEAGKKFTRDYLVDLLWPDAPAPRANHSLAQALSVLKAKLGREHVLIQKATVALADGVVDADVRRLDGAAVEIRGPFLDGFEIPGAPSFEQWKDEWRARLMPRLRDCLVKQMDAGRRTGDFAMVERHAQVLLDLDPLSEDAVRGIMEARAWVGDRTNALKAFARFEARLAEELGAKPSVDLVRIVDLLREGRRAPPRPVGEGEGEAARASPPRIRRFEAETLIGREREFSVLYDAWLEARRRTPRIVVLSGDPGVGKTTLTNAFLSTCQMEGAVIARAQAYDAERELPFAVLAELVKQLAGQRAIGGADPEELAELSRLSPEVTRAFPGVPKPPEWPAEVVPLRLADAFLKTVEAAAEENPVVLVVDDIHASDNASAAILHVVARKLPLTRLLVILAGRRAELRVSDAPAALVADATIEALRALELAPLTPEQAQQLVDRLAAGAGAERGDPPTARILQASGGNPLAIELLTKEWVEHGSHSLLKDLEGLNTQPAATIGIPRAISTVFERQVRRLDPQSLAALDLAAVLGHRLSDLTMYQPIGLGPGQTAETLSQLHEDGILREVRGELEFRNELIRAQAYYHVPSRARQQLHQCVADLLAKRPPSESDPLEIAWHYLRAEKALEAAPYALEGAEAALRAGAPREAERILTVLVREPQVAGRLQQGQLLLARALMDQSKAEAAMPVLASLGEDRSLSPRGLAEISRLEAAAAYLINTQTGTKHYEAAERALATAQGSDDPELIGLALFEYAQSGAEFGDAERVRAAKREIEALLSDERASRIPHLHYAQGYCHTFFCDAYPAAKSLETALHLLGDSASAVERSRYQTGLSVCRRDILDLEGAVRAAQVALELAHRMGDDSRASVIAANLCCIRVLQGQTADGLQHGLRSLAYGLRALSQPLLLMGYLNLAEAYVIAGQQERALESWERARAWVGKQRSWRVNVLFFVESACLAMMLGNTSLAIEYATALEDALCGREQAAPEGGAVAKCRAFRAFYVAGPQVSLRLAAEAAARFRHRHPLWYSDAMATLAWAEKRVTGSYSDETSKELNNLLAAPIPGKLRELEMQGFLA